MPSVCISIALYVLIFAAFFKMPGNNVEGLVGVLEDDSGKGFEVEMVVVDVVLVIVLSVVETVRLDRGYCCCC